MPAVFDSLVRDRGLTPHVSWRVAFIVPSILLIATGVGVLLLAEDHPNGKWSQRHLPYGHQNSTIESDPIARSDSDKMSAASSEKKSAAGTVKVVAAVDEKGEKRVIEVVQKPSLKTTLSALVCMQTLMLAAPYFCTFGGELAINSILSSYYLSHFPSWGQTKAGQWAAMFGLLNVSQRGIR